LLGAFFRFYKLDWGEGIFFHPDERNIASLATSISPPIDPQFFAKGTFAYGSFISYLIFGVNLFLHIFSPILPPYDNFALNIILLRIFSAFFSTFAVVIVYLIGNKAWNKKIGILAAGMTAFSPGLIQAAHFGTFESVLTFLYLLIFLFNVKLLKDHAFKNFLFAVLSTAIASAIKINSLVFLPLSILTLFISGGIRKRVVAKLLVFLAGVLIFPLLVMFLSPYYLTPGFKNMLLYEQQVVSGTLDVFYTRQFFETKPLIFPLFQILPFLVNPFVILFFVLLLFFYFFNLIRKLLGKSGLPEPFLELMLLGFVAALFLPNAFLFAKWTRYMVPLAPFLILSVSFLVEKLISQKLATIIFSWLTATSFFWGVAFLPIYSNQDTRLAASNWIYRNIPENSGIINETANVIDIPVAPMGNLPHRNYLIKTFDFYNLDNNGALFKELILDLEKANYILIPSRRLFGGMGQFPNRYPLLGRYYELLFSGKLGFREVKRFTSYPKLGPIDFPDESAEETWSVFDHPVIRIYQKVKPLTIQDYENLLQI
jgi:hypothetical protein